MVKLILILLLLPTILIATGDWMLELRNIGEEYVEVGGGYKQLKLAIGKQTPITEVSGEFIFCDNIVCGVGISAGLGLSDKEYFNIFLKPQIGMSGNTFYFGGTGKYYARLYKGLKIFTEIGVFGDNKGRCNWLWVVGLRYNFDVERKP